MKAMKRLAAMLLVLVLFAGLLAPAIPKAKAAISPKATNSSSQIYYNIDMSAAVLASRTNQQVSGDCAVVSMATIEAFMYGATSAADRKTVYDALVSKNGDNNYAYWSNCGYVSHNSVNWTTVYDNLSKGYPVIVHRPANGNKVEHWAVVAGYKGSTTTLEKDKFVIVDVYHGSGGTDIYTSGAWRGGVSIDRMVTRKNGTAITSLAGIKMAINHPATVHQYSQGHGVYGYVTSNTNLTSVQFMITNVNTGANVFNKTVTPNAKSYLIYNLDSEFTFAKWPVGEYFFTVIAKTSSSARNYQTYFQIVSGWPTTLPTRAYTFSFNSNGGSGSVAAQTVSYGGTLTIPTAKPTRAGYTFAGWNVKRTTDGTWYCDANGWCTDAQINASGAVPRVYTPGDKYANFGFEWVKGCFTNKEYTFYAVWKADETAAYTVSYNANGGTGAPASQTKTHDVSLTLSTTKPTREGYTFQGWATSATATTAAYQPGAAYTSNANTTLYAVWEKNAVSTYTVSYNANGGSGSMSDTTVSYGTSTALRANAFTRLGYTFGGWNAYRISDQKWAYANSSGTIGWYLEGQQPAGYTKYTYIDKASVSQTSAVDKDVVIMYAVWNANSYTVTYNANGGSGAPASQTKTHDVSLTLSTTKPTREGYTFQGWATSATVTTAAYQPGAAYTSNTNTTLYAVWKQNVVSTDAQIALDNKTAYCGSTVSVDVKLVNNPGFSVLNVAFLYDTEYLTLTSVENKVPSMVMTHNASVLWDSATNHVTDGVLATLNFAVAENAPEGDYEIKVIFMGASNEAFEEVQMAGVSGVLTVTSTVYGDANGDGTVTTVDLAMLRKYLSSMDPITGISSVALKVGGDCNGDGTVNTIDLAMLRKYLAGMDPITGESSVVLGPK